MASKRKRAEANRKRFTEDNVLKLPAKSKQYLIWDQGTDAARGLAILVSPTGTKSFRAAFYFPGSPKPHYMHIGRVGEVSLQDARKACRDARALAKPSDPKAEPQDPRAGAATKSDSFKAAVEDYIKHEQVGRAGNTSALETQKVILGGCKEWHARPVATIRGGEIEKLLWMIRDGEREKKDGDPEKKLRPRPYMANRLHSHLKAFFSWCARPHGPIKSSPMTGMKKPFNKEKSRDRDWFKGAAADEAIKAIWKAADEVGGAEGKYLKTMLLLGKRRTALSLMGWKEIGADWFWNAPPSDSTKRLHGVPLPTLAQRVLGPRQASGRVFGDLDRAALDSLQHRVRKATGIGDFFWHGIRHLAETKTAELRDEKDRSLVPPHIRDLLFDHVPPRGSGAAYDHHSYKPEMRAALEAWAAHVEGLVTAEGVRRLR